MYLYDYLWGAPEYTVAPDYPSSYPIPYSYGLPGNPLIANAYGFSSDSQRQKTPDLKGGAETAREEPHAKHVDLSAMFPKDLFLHGPENVKHVSLTFDDAPDDTFTPRVLDVLKQVNVKGTFFVIGERAAAHPDIMKRIVEEGHVIGNHTWNHPNLTKITKQEQAYQLDHTENVIDQITGVRTALFRPPYGALNPEVIEVLIKRKYKIIYWNVDSLDWMGLTGPQVTANILAHTRAGSIILQHAAGGKGEDLSGTIAAIPYFVQTLRSEGFTFVTIPQLLNIPATK
ncbi:polysaccharide deacetylase family protein [Fodinisporobacter ferrooxydans]|uniref:Polysaccharide deacetylase family protein n=1 Tax=Fodinisporobacter ferrooxydans TaxID=2901836 RepID=A0ABY4CLW7_9BACL|nr:polysaccharide deacetylase family protein [Alicyclobacillaceae bacterium MYW30-H2]